METPPAARPRSSSPLRPQNSPMRPVAHSNAMKSHTGPRSRSRSPSARSGLYYSPMRPVAHSDSPIPTTHMLINIKTQAGKTITMDVEESDTIGNIKDDLVCYHGMDCGGKRLMRGCGELADMGQLGIKDGDTLHLLDSPGPSGKQVFVRTPTGKTLPIDVDVSDTIENVKRKIARIEGVDAMTLSLHLEPDKNFSDYVIPGTVYILYMLPVYPNVSIV